MEFTIRRQSLIGPKFEFHSHSNAENIYKSVELAYQKIHKQLQKEKRSGETEFIRVTLT